MNSKKSLLYIFFFNRTQGDNFQRFVAERTVPLKIFCTIQGDNFERFIARRTVTLKLPADKLNSQSAALYGGKDRHLEDIWYNPRWQLWALYFGKDCHLRLTAGKLNSQSVALHGAKDRRLENILRNPRWQFWPLYHGKDRHLESTSWWFEQPICSAYGGKDRRLESIMRKPTMTNINCFIAALGWGWQNQSIRSVVSVPNKGYNYSALWTRHLESQM